MLLEKHELVDFNGGNTDASYYGNVDNFHDKGEIPEKYKLCKKGLKYQKKRVKQYRILNFPLSILTSSRFVYCEKTKYCSDLIKNDLAKI